MAKATSSTVLVTASAELQEAVRRCAVSRPQRRAMADELRNWYERGSAAGGPARYNKVRAHIDRVSSYLFAPATTRFSVHLPPAAREPWLQAAELARDEFRARWSDSGADLTVPLLIEWALVYGATIGKLQATPSGFQLGYIAPWDFGVSREDVPMLDEQDTIAHWYVLSIPQAERWLRGHVDGARILAELKSYARPGLATPARQGLVISGVSGTFPGSTVTGGFPGEAGEPSDQLGAVVEEPVVELVDCWERQLWARKSPVRARREVFEDWRVTTLVADHDLVLFERRNPDLPWTSLGGDQALPGELPFVVMRPRPVPDYFWGRSELTSIRRLQEWLDDHLADMSLLLKKQLDPSKFFSGVPDFEEAGRALSTPGGAYGTPDPTAKMDTIRPEIGQEPFAMIRLLESFFADASGIPESLAEPGSVPGGVRAMGHFSMIAGIGAGRIRRMALVVEDAIAEIATKAFHLLQRHDTSLYRLPDGRTFLLAQLPPGISLRVSAHSSAPIYAEQTQAKAILMQRAGVLEAEDFVELLDPPNRDELKAKARRLAERKAELARQMLEIEAQKVGRRPRRLRPEL